MSSKPTPEPEQTTSAPLVTPRFRFGPDGLGQIEQAEVKCGPCEGVTYHEWFKVAPVDTAGLLGTLEINAMTKRLTMCTQCGNLRLTK